tara:strand:- start:206 stop:397 length:192 start_codon:yes stop_codon:yes gene_type:complete
VGGAADCATVKVVETRTRKAFMTLKFFLAGSEVCESLPRVLLLFWPIVKNLASSVNFYKSQLI